jgi:acyl carrier protein
MTQISTQAGDQDGISARVRDVVGSLVPGGRRDVQEAERMTDLSFDSLAPLELAMALETEFELLEVPEGQAVEMTTVGDIESLVGSLVAAPATSG